MNITAAINKRMSILALQLILIIILSIVTVTPFYNDATKININYKIKLLALLFNMIFRLILMTLSMYFLYQFTDFTLTMLQIYLSLSFIVIHFCLIIYSTYIIYKCERLTYIAREKTKSRSVVAR